MAGSCNRKVPCSEQGRKTAVTVQNGHRRKRLTMLWLTRKAVILCCLLTAHCAVPQYDPEPITATGIQDADVSAYTDTWISNVTSGFASANSEPVEMCDWPEQKSPTPTLHVINLYSDLIRGVNFGDVVDFAAELVSNSSNILPGYQLLVHHRKSEQVRSVRCGYRGG